jgi:hypothetical protein
MKKLFILILTLISIQSFGQSTSPTGYTRFFSKSSGDYWNINAGNIVTKDTNTAPIAIGEVRLKTSDSTVYIGLSTSASKKWYKIRGESVSGAGLGSVTSVGISIDGSVISESGTPVTGSGTLALTWQGSATDVTLGNGSYTNLPNAIRAVTDPLYSPIGHTHTSTQITDFTSAVRAQFTAGTNISISSAGVISSTSSTNINDGLLSGGIVTWTGSGLVFDVTAASYVIGGTPYTSSVDQVTLDPADATFGRYDVIAVDITGNAVVITGTAAASPVIPQVDPADQIYLTTVFIDAGATTPTLVSDELVYDENTEWSHSTSGSVAANFASTIFAQHGTKSVLTTWTANSNLIFTTGSTLVSSNYNTFSYYIRLTNTMANNTNVSVQFYNGSNPVSNQVTSTISKSTTGAFQLVSFNMSQFAFTSSQFNSVRLILTGATSNAVYFDYIRLQTGVIPPTGGTGIQNAYSSITDGTTTGISSGSDVFKLRSADNKLSIAVTNNDATHGDNALFTVNQGNLSLSSIGGSLNVSQINATGTPSSSTVLYGNGTWGTIGSGVQAHGVSILKNYSTQTQSTGSSTTDNITVVAIPANALSTNGDAIEIDIAYVTTGVDTKTVAAAIGGSSTILASSASTTAANYVHRIKLFRTSSTAASYRSEGYRDNNIFASGQGVNTSFDWTVSQNFVVSLTSVSAASITITYIQIKVVKE